MFIVAMAGLLWKENCVYGKVCQYCQPGLFLQVRFQHKSSARFRGWEKATINVPEEFVPVVRQACLEPVPDGTRHEAKKRGSTAPARLPFATWRKRRQ
jgi:hypothetical protein